MIFTTITPPHPDDRLADWYRAGGHRLSLEQQAMTPRKWVFINEEWTPLEQTGFTEADWLRLKRRGRLPVYEGDDHPLMALADEDCMEER